MKVQKPRKYLNVPKMLISLDYLIMKLRWGPDNKIAKLFLANIELSLYLVVVVVGSFQSHPISIMFKTEGGICAGQLCNAAIFALHWTLHLHKTILTNSPVRCSGQVPGAGVYEQAALFHLETISCKDHVQCFYCFRFMILSIPFR